MMAQGTILVVEDDENDLEMLEQALLGAGVPNPIQMLRNGLEAIEYLKGEGESGAIHWKRRVERG